MGVPGPWTGVTVPPAPNAKVEGGIGGLAEGPELDVAGEGPTGVVVPATGAPVVGSQGGSSPWAAGAGPPRSMKRERSFLSRAWMSSTLPWDSTLASHLPSHDSSQRAWLCPGGAAEQPSEVTVRRPKGRPGVRDEDEGEREAGEDERGDWEEAVDVTSWGPAAATAVTAEVDRVAGGLEQGSGVRLGPSHAAPPSRGAKEEDEGVGGGGENTGGRVAEGGAEGGDVWVAKPVAGEDRGTGQAVEQSGGACATAFWAWAEAWGWICAWGRSCG